ncbi:hypothetical protein [Bradyrhizobium nanningense]|uniref:hypothetical protein n=1 Tax=Bradyrhizobium nanningense TaxID=1325118 RepID=UPI001008F9D3|nr:hypothetical protein [Bradyrhizobium nanningense]
MFAENLDASGANPMPKPALRATLSQPCLQLNAIDAVHSAAYTTFRMKLNGAKAKRRPLAPLHGAKAKRRPLAPLP